MKLALIGGTGFYAADFLGSVQTVEVETRYGSVQLSSGQRGDVTVYFLSRHGKGHRLPPHQVNYRANIAALKRLEVQGIFATNAVGSLNAEFKPGNLVLIDQFLDFTKNRPNTFFQGEDLPVVHTDMSHPYCRYLRQAIFNQGQALGMPVHDHGTYVCTEGPRFESAAEITMFQTLGGGVVGMTGLPEVALAREAGICYAGISLVTNFGAGISPEPLTHEEVVEMMEKNGERCLTLLLATIEQLPHAWSCGCEKRPEADRIG